MAFTWASFSQPVSFAAPSGFPGAEPMVSSVAPHDTARPPTLGIGGPIRRCNRVPTIEERSAIQAMVERDQTILISLEQYKAQQHEKIAQGKTDIEKCQDLLTITKTRYEAATSLYQSLDESLRSIRTSTQSDVSFLPTNISASSPHLSALSETLRIKNDTIEALSSAALKARESMERGQEAFIMAQEHHQGLLAIAARNEEEMQHLEKEIVAFQASITKKRLPLRAIFRLPSDVWEIVFEEVVRDDGECIPIGRGVATGWKHGCRALALSAVCYTWRSMVQSLPSLWRYIFISVGPSLSAQLPRIRYYVKMCKTRLPIVAIQAFQGISRNIDFRTNPIFPESTFSKLECVFCTVSEGSYTSLYTLLKSFPPPIEFSLQRQDNPYILTFIDASLTLPLRFLSALKRFSQTNVAIRWESTGNSNERDVSGLEEYRMSCHSGSIPTWISLSYHRLRCMTLDVVQLVASTRFQFPTLEEIRAPLDILLGTLTQVHSFPKLKKIVITKTSGCTPETDFRDGFSSIECGNIRTLVVEYMVYGHASGVVTFASRFPNLDTLELDSGSADPIVNCLDAPHWIRRSNNLSIKKLVICSYIGRGDAILSFVKRRAAVIKGARPGVSEDGISGRGEAAGSTCQFLQAIEFLGSPRHLDWAAKAEIDRILSSSVRDVIAVTQDGGH